MNCATQPAFTVVLEGRSILVTARHITRSSRAFGLRHLCTGIPGRCSLPVAPRVCRQRASLYLASFTRGN